MATRPSNTSSQQTAAKTGGPLDEVRAGLLRLHKKTDDFFASVLKEHRSRMRCAPGCSACCHTMPSIFPVEAWIVAETLAASPEPLVRKVLHSLQPHEDKSQVKPCPLLDRRGWCVVYGARPIICRSHGVPIKVPGRNASDFDVCPLNFSSPEMRRFVETDSVLDLDRLNEILSVVDSLFRQAHPLGEKLPLRVPLAQGIFYFYRLLSD